MLVEIKIFLKYMICKIPKESYTWERGAKREKLNERKKKEVANIFRPLPTATVTETRNLYEWPWSDQC